MKKENEAKKLERKPMVKRKINWKEDESGIITLEIENKGILKRLFRLPRISFVRLDETGSFVWQRIDGKRSVSEIGKELEEHFGTAAAPVFARLLRFFEILESYSFIQWEE